ncbi:MAG TPA: hypothetical protein VIJ18_00410 [Microbacteriaceae bacterium]
MRRFSVADAAPSAIESTSVDAGRRSALVEEQWRSANRGHLAWGTGLEAPYG